MPKPRYLGDPGCRDAWHMPEWPTYRVDFGTCSFGEFRTFAEALECARKNKPARIVNPGEADGAPDSSARAQAGLTREEWAVLEEEGFV